VFLVERRARFISPWQAVASRDTLSLTRPRPNSNPDGAAMQLGFVSAILGDLSLPEVLAFAADQGFGCVELMCWPPGGSERRYGGVCHVDVSNFTDAEAHSIQELVRLHEVAISGLGYYPNPLDPDPEHRRVVVGHLKKVISAAPKLGVRVVNTFIGRDPTK